MEIVTIDVRRDELHKLDNYYILATDSALRAFVTSSTDIGELDSYEVDTIIEECKTAIELDLLGVNVEIELGRSPQNDERTYTLMSTCLVSKEYEYCDLRVSEMVDYMNNYFNKGK